MQINPLCSSEADYNRTASGASFVDTESGKTIISHSTSSISVINCDDWNFNEEQDTLWHVATVSTKHTSTWRIMKQQCAIFDEECNAA